MADDFDADIPALINDALSPLPDGAPPLPGADPAIRVFSRVVRMSQLTRAGADIFDSPAVKTLRLAGFTGGALALLHKLVELGLRLFGVL